MLFPMGAEKRTPTEIRMRAAMSARVQLMLKRHPQITTYYKLEAAAKVSSTCLHNMRDGNNERTYGLGLMNAYKIASALDISLAELVSSPEEFFDRALVPMPQSIEDLRACIADKIRLLMHSRADTNTTRKLHLASKVDERAIRRALGKADDFVPTLTTLAGLADFFQEPVSAFFIPAGADTDDEGTLPVTDSFNIEALKTRLRVSRTSARITIGEMAQRMEVLPEKLSRWESLDKPKYLPSIEEIQEWARITNRKVSWMFSADLPSQPGALGTDTTFRRLTDEKRWFVNEMTSLLIDHDVPADALEARLRLLATFPRSTDPK